MYIPSSRRFSSALAAFVFAATLTLSAVAPDAVQASDTTPCASKAPFIPSFQ